MARVSKELAAQREAIMRSLIRASPTLSVPALQDAFVQRTKQPPLRAKRVRELKVEEGFNSRTGEAVKGGNGKKGKPSLNGNHVGYPIIIKREPTDTPVSFAAKVLEELRGRKEISLRVSSQTDDWIAIDPAT